MKFNSQPRLPAGMVKLPLTHERIEQILDEVFFKIVKLPGD